MSLKLRRLFCGIIICFFALYAAGSPLSGWAAEREVRYLPFTFNVDVFATGNLQGYIMDWDYSIPQTAELGTAKISALLKRDRTASNYSLLIDAGSMQYGSPLTEHYAKTGFKGIQPMIKASNYMFYDVMVLGGTDFAHGKDALLKAVAKSKATILAANVYDTKKGKEWNKIQPYFIKTFTIGDKAKAKVNIGVIGVTDKDGLPQNEEMSSLIITDQVEAVKKYTKELQKKKVDAIIVVTSSGLNTINNQETADENQVVAIAQNCPDINLIISSHKFSVIDDANPITDSKGKPIYEHGMINGVHILSSGQKGNYLGKATLTFEMFGRKYWLKTVSTANISTAGIVPDKGLSDLCWPYHDSVLQSQAKIIGTAESDFVFPDIANRNLAAIEFLNRVQLNFSKAQLSAASLFNLDPKIKQGSITVQDINSFYPADNYLYTIKISGSQLKSYLEHAARYFQTFREGDRVIQVGSEGNTLGEFSYDIVQGVDYIIDITQPPGNRIKNLSYNDLPVKEDDIFTLAINSSRYIGGGGYLDAIGFDKTNPYLIVFDSKKEFGNNGQMRSLIIQYIKEQKIIKPAIPDNFKVITEPFTPVQTHF